jgi:hypothetical protein
LIPGHARIEDYFTQREIGGTHDLAIEAATVFQE